MSAALPPRGMHTEDEPKPKGPTLGDLLRVVAIGITLNLVAMLIVATIVQFGWNSLIDNGPLAITFAQAFTGAILVRVAALTVRL